MAGRLAIGQRTILAMTCNQCGKLKDGTSFPRYRRQPHEPEYVSRRCRLCWWRPLELSYGRDRYAV